MLQGTVFEIVGSRISGGRSGNHYEVVDRDVLFDEWNNQDLVLGEQVYIVGSTVPKGQDDMSYYILHPEECVEGHFFVILKNHRRWGVFLPLHPKTGKYAPLHSIVETLIWYRNDGEQPVIENDDPGTFYYRTIVENGVEIDALERVRT